MLFKHDNEPLKSKILQDRKRYIVFFQRMFNVVRVIKGGEKRVRFGYENSTMITFKKNEGKDKRSQIQ
jgi:hypothetical protein